MAQSKKPMLNAKTWLPGARADPTFARSCVEANANQLDQERPVGCAWSVALVSRCAGGDSSWRARAGVGNRTAARNNASRPDVEIFAYVRIGRLRQQKTCHHPTRTLLAQPIDLIEGQRVTEASNRAERMRPKGG